MTSFWSGILFGSYRVWEDEPGGTVVRRYRQDGIEYVVVVFEKSPEKEYIFLAR